MLCESFKKATEKKMQQNLKIEEERQKREGGKRCSMSCQCYKYF